MPISPHAHFRAVLNVAGTLVAGERCGLELCLYRFLTFDISTCHVLDYLFVRCCHCSLYNEMQYKQKFTIIFNQTRTRVVREWRSQLHAIMDYGRVDCRSLRLGENLGQEIWSRFIIFFALDYAANHPLSLHQTWRWFLLFGGVGSAQS